MAFAETWPDVVLDARPRSFFISAQSLRVAREDAEENLGVLPGEPERPEQQAAVVRLRAEDARVARGRHRETRCPRKITLILNG